MKTWVNDLNTTSFRITISVIMAAVLCTVVTGAVVILNWLPTSQQIMVLAGVATMILTMMGFDVLQYWGQRRTDVRYIEAKNSGPSPVSIAPPSEVTIANNNGDTTTVSATKPDPEPEPVLPSQPLPKNVLANPTTASD